MFVQEVLSVTDQQMGINYGIDRIRFLSPVPVGSRIRGKLKLVDAERKTQGVLYRVGVEIEIEGAEKPALVGEILYLAVV
jgi:acyl dehydratase